MTFLFDIGRVLLDFDFESSLRRLLPVDCSDSSQRLAKLIERKDAFESGAIDPDDYITWALQTIGSDATPEAFLHAWQNIFTPNQAMWECVSRLAESGEHRLILFSNTNALHCPWAFEVFPDFMMFDEAVLSFETGSIKPHPEIYQYAVDAYGLVAEETIYIDDLAENIATGREFGFHCWQYDLNDHVAFEQWLASRLSKN